MLQIIERQRLSTPHFHRRRQASPMSSIPHFQDDIVSRFPLTSDLHTLLEGKTVGKNKASCHMLKSLTVKLQLSTMAQEDDAVGTSTSPLAWPGPHYSPTTSTSPWGMAEHHGIAEASISLSALTAQLQIAAGSICVQTETGCDEQPWQGRFQHLLTCHHWTCRSGRH